MLLMRVSCDDLSAKLSVTFSMLGTAYTVMVWGVAFDRVCAHDEALTYVSTVVIVLVQPYRQLRNRVRGAGGVDVEAWWW